MNQFTLTVTAAFTLFGTAESKTATVTGNFASGKIQEIDVDDDAAQGNEWLVRAPVGLDAGTLIMIMNNTGWAINIDRNDGGEPQTLSPGSADIYAVTATASAVGDFDATYYSARLSLSSALGTPGKLDIVFLGVAL